MKLKLDENLGNRCIDILRGDGHDVETVASQGMVSAEDSDLITVCKTEARALVTLDLDFSNPIIFPPDKYAGIPVLRLRPRASHPELVAAVRTLAGALK